MLDRAGRVQLPREYRDALNLVGRVRLALEESHVSLWPDRPAPTPAPAGPPAGAPPRAAAGTRPRRGRPTPPTPEPRLDLARRPTGDHRH